MNTKRVFVKSYGCSANQADGEVILGCLAEAGFKIVQSDLEADVLVYNCCAVKGPTEDRMFEVLKHAPEDKRLVVTGCLPLICYERLCREVGFDCVVGPSPGALIVDAVTHALRGERFVALEASLSRKLNLRLPRTRSNSVISIVPVSCGCLGSCSYCCVIFARGALRSCCPDEIAARIKADLALGAREFWITSQDTGCYGKDIGTNLADLLKKICEVQGDFRVRVGMMTPNFAETLLSQLVDAYKNPKVFKFVHLPVQSGDNSILKRMRRGYTIENFGKVAEAFRGEFPQITLATDVICGFPGETRSNFKKTLAAIGKFEPDVVNVSRFFARPGTAAAEMLDKVDPAEIKVRSAELSEMARRMALARNQRWVNWTGDVLVDEKGKRSDSWIGRNCAYKPIVVKSSENLFGRVICVRVAKAYSTYLFAEIL